MISTLNETYENVLGKWLCFPAPPPPSLSPSPSLSVALTIHPIISTNATVFSSIMKQKVYLADTLH